MGAGSRQRGVDWEQAKGWRNAGREKKSSLGAGREYAGRGIYSIAAWEWSRGYSQGSAYRHAGRRASR
jgi:hypothetical protein